MQLEITTLLALGSFIVAIGTLIWRSGSEAAQRKAFEVYAAKVDTDRQKWREDFERSVEQRFAASSGAATLAREQIADVRENIAKNYMTKGEIGDIERRVTDKQERILSQLDRLNERLDNLQEKLLEAIGRSHGLHG